MTIDEDYIEKYYDLFENHMEQKSITNNIARQCISLTEEKARELCEENNIRVRAVCKNGHNFIVTRDYRIDRINLKIENDIVVQAYLG